MTYLSSLRRHIGTEILNFELQERNGKKRYFDASEDKKVTQFLSTCKATFYPTYFGRYELEEFLRASGHDMRLLYRDLVKVAAGRFGDRLAVMSKMLTAGNAPAHHEAQATAKFDQFYRT